MNEEVREAILDWLSGPPVADPLDRPRHDDHAQAPLAHVGLAHHVDETLDDLFAQLDAALG